MAEKKGAHNIVEKFTFFTGILMLITLIGYLLFLISQEQTNPPQLEITTSFEPDIKDYAYKIDVQNNGQETAQEAKIALVLYQDGEAVENTSVNFKYIPVGSKKTAWVVFPRSKKAQDSLAVSSVTYVKP